jgi:hypothetical protein
MNTVVHLSELLEGVLNTACDAIVSVERENGLRIANLSVETSFRMEKRIDAEGVPQLYVNSASKSFTRGATRNLTRSFGTIKIGVSSRPRFDRNI